MSHQPDDHDLATVADVKAWLGIPSSETAVDDILQRLTTNASVATLQHLSRALFLDTFTERRTGTGTATLTLREFPIRSIKSLTISGTEMSASAGPGQPGYVFEDDTVYLAPGVFPLLPPLAVMVKYKAGYDDVPSDIGEAVIHWVGLRFRERDRIGQSSKGLAGETTAYVLRDMPEHVARMLQPYKRVSIL